MFPCLQTKTKVSRYSLCEKNKRFMLQTNKQNYRVTVVNESVSITFDVLVLLEIKCRHEEGMNNLKIIQIETQDKKISVICVFANPHMRNEAIWSWWRACCV